MPPLAPDAQAAPPSAAHLSMNAGCSSSGAVSPISTFNAYLARAKTKAIECLLNICENADHSATPADIRRAATAILRCSPLHDDDDQLQSQRARPRHHIPDKPPIIQPTPAHTPVPPTTVFSGRCSSPHSAPLPSAELPPGGAGVSPAHAPASSAPANSSAPPAPASPSPQSPDAEQRVPSSPPEADRPLPLSLDAQSAAQTPPPPAPSIAHLLGEPSPQSLTPSIDEIFRALAALEALRRSDPERHQHLDPGNTLQPLIDFIRSVYPIEGLPPDHPLSIAIRDINAAHRAAERQHAALNHALADLRAAAPSNNNPDVCAPYPDPATSPIRRILASPPGSHPFDVVTNTHSFASAPDARGPPAPPAA